VTKESVISTEMAHARPSQRLQLTPLPKAVSPVAPLAPLVSAPSKLANPTLPSQSPSILDRNGRPKLSNPTSNTNNNTSPNSTNLANANANNSGTTSPNNNSYSFDKNIGTYVWNGHFWNFMAQRWLPLSGPLSGSPSYSPVSPSANELALAQNMSNLDGGPSKK
jgi:hypothetical protein